MVGSRTLVSVEQRVHVVIGAWLLHDNVNDFYVGYALITFSNLINDEPPDFFILSLKVPLLSLC